MKGTKRRATRVRGVIDGGEKKETPWETKQKISRTMRMKLNRDGAELRKKEISEGEEHKRKFREISCSF